MRFITFYLKTSKMLSSLLYNLYWILIVILICLIGIPGFYVYDSIAVLGPYLKEELNYTQVEIAWLYSCYYFPNIILSLFAGILIDKWGERKCSILFSCITVLGQSIISLFPTIWPMSIGRFILGIAGEGMFICQLKLFSTIFSSRISLVLSISLVFNRLCTLLAYLTLTPIAEINLYLALYTCTIVCIICLIINVLFIFIEYIGMKNSYLYPIKIDIINPKNINILKGIKQCLKSFPLWCLILIGFLYYGAFLSYASLSPIFISKYYSYDVKTSNFIVSLLSFGSIIGALSFGYISDKTGRKLFLMYLGILFGLIPFAILSITNTVNIIILTISLGISYGAVPCILYSLISLMVDKEYIGIATGLIEVSNAWAVLIFPLLFGLISDIGSPLLGISCFTILLGLCLIIIIVLFGYSKFKLNDQYKNIDIDETSPLIK